MFSGVSVWEGEKVLEMNGGASFTTLRASIVSGPPEVAVVNEAFRSHSPRKGTEC